MSKICDFFYIYYYFTYILFIKSNYNFESGTKDGFNALHMDTHVFIVCKYVKLNFNQKRTQIEISL